MSEPTKNYWDRLIDTVEQAKNYIRSYGEGVDFPSRMKLLELVKDGESLLDVGCGPACELENIQKYNKQINYVGVDYSEKMIQACKELYPNENFQVMDARKLDFPSQSFDTVLLRHVVEYLHPYQVPIEEAWRVAKKRVVLIFWIPPQEKPDLIRFQEDDDKSQVNRYNKTELLNYLKTLTPKVQIWENVGKCNTVILLEK